MKELIHKNRFKKLFFFWSGILATIAYRAIVLLDEFWTHIAWYVGTVGFILYFGHRAHVQKKKSDLVIKNDLVTVVDSLKHIRKDQKEALHYIISSDRNSNARWNSLAIFWLTIIALAVGIVYDFII